MNSTTLRLLFALLAISVNRAWATPINIAVDLDSLNIIGGNGSPPVSVETQPGFTSWDVTTLPVSGATKVIGGITFDLFGFTVAGQSRYRNAFDPRDIPGDFLLRDFVYNDDSLALNPFIGLRISGLDAGTYSMRSWHYDGLFIALRDRNFLQIEVRNQGSASPPPIVDAFPFGFDAAEFQFDVTSSGQVKEIIFRADGGFSTSGTNFVNRSRLNGFTLVSVPEPNVSVLCMFAALLSMGRRRWTG
jgi:hypothetical protein